MRKHSRPVGQRQPCPLTSAARATNVSCLVHSDNRESRPTPDSGPEMGRTARELMKRTLTPESLQEIATRLEQAHKALQRRYPGPPGDRQPIHVVYGGAHLFRAGTARKFGDLALKSLDDYGPDFAAFAKAIGLPGAGSLPDSPEAAASVASRSKPTRKQRGERTPLRGSPTRSIGGFAKNCAASRSRISGSISRMDTATVRTPKKTATRHRQRWKSARG